VGMKTILITGINGFLGSHLAKRLSKDYKIVGLEYSVRNLFRLKDYSFKIYSSDDETDTIFKENEIFAIIHAATVYRRSSDPIENLILTNILLPVKLFELANSFNVTLFLNTDSFFNNEKYNYLFLPEYTLSKKHVLEWLKFIEDGCKLINMKIFHMYGPDDSPDKFIPQITAKLKNNVPHIDITLGEQTRDFIYISDVVEAYKMVLQKSSMMKMFVEFEVGTGKEISLKKIILKIKELTKSETKLNFGALNYRPNEIMKSKANTKALCNLGWEPKITIEKGIKSLRGI
jgi:nucleoside-diphosphate-sugar epimerase